MVKKDRSKVSQLSDRMVLDNAIGAFLTETWLTSDVIDAEIDIPGYSVFRSNRNGCVHGGVACYLKSDLGGVISHTFSNCVVETLIVKCKSIKNIFLKVYRPPNSC